MGKVLAGPCRSSSCCVQVASTPIKARYGSVHRPTSEERKRVGALGSASWHSENGSVRSKNQAEEQLEEDTCACTWAIARTHTHTHPAEKRNVKDIGVKCLWNSRRA